MYPLTRFDNQFNGCPLLAVNAYICKRGSADEIDARWGQKTAGDGYRLHRLIQCTGANGLYLCDAVFPDHARECTRNCIRAGF